MLGRPLLVLTLVVGCRSPGEPVRDDVGPSEPQVRSGGPALPFLRPPFDGPFQASNPFDHGTGPGAGRVGGVIDWRGEQVLGSRAHRGWDWRLPLGTPVLAAAEGVVQHAGAVPAFPCALLGRDVSDQLAVVVQHVAPDGSVWETGVDHLSQVSVTVGQTVAAGEPLGLSGNTGCSNGEHLHFSVYRHLDGRSLPVDPFGWEGAGADPWTRSPAGGASVWLWATAPRLQFVTTRPADATAGRSPVVVASVGYQGWRDAQDLHAEYVELALDPRFADADRLALDGWQLVLPGGAVHRLGADHVVAVGAPLRLHGGVGASNGRVHFLGTDAPSLPDGGGRVSLLDPGGVEVHALAYGLERPQRLHVSQPPREDPCPPDTDGCVPLGRPGGVRDLAWSPDGTRLALVVGAAARPLLVVPDRVPVDVRPLDGVGGAPAGSDHLAWLGDDLLLLDAPRVGGGRTVWTVIPGMSAAEAFPDDAGVVLTVGDARARRVLLARASGQASHLLAWSPDAPRLVPVGLHRHPEEQPRLSPDGGRVVFLRAGQRHVVDLSTGASVEVTPEPRSDTVHAWLGGQVVVLRRDRLERLDGSLVQADLAPGLLVDAHGAIAVVTVGGEIRVLGVGGAVLARHPLGAVPDAIALAHGPDGWRVAWTLPTRPGGPPALGWARLGSPPISRAAPGSAAP